jgi:predicted phosphoadenosine phosphosulfate sulfurtransferase
VRDKEPDSIHVNDFGVDRFAKVLTATGDREVPGGCVLTGVRAQESRARRVGLTTMPTYKWATWGSKQPNHVVLHPIYDWTYRDVWHAIHTNGWAYNRLYTEMYRWGIRPDRMAVSNYHHEQAVGYLFYLQEVEPATWAKATKRLHGINTAGHVGADDFYAADLPFMFNDWVDYRDYLLANLITDLDARAKFTRKFESIDRRLWYVDANKRARAMANALILNDVYFTTLGHFEIANQLAPSEIAALEAQGLGPPS